MDLAFEDDALRQLIKSQALKQIGLVRHNPSLWLNTPKPLQARFEKAVVALADVNFEIKYLVRAFVASEPGLWAHLRAMIRKCLLFVLSLIRNVF